MYHCRREFTAARGRGNFSSLLLNVAGGNVGYLSNKVIRRLIERSTLDSLCAWKNILQRTLSFTKCGLAESWVVTFIID